jgi:TrmH family RNA methyltransferase
MEAICDVESSQGAVALAVQPRFELEDVFANDGPVVVVETVQDPGNLGTILRTAEGAGAAGIVTTPGSAEPYTPKALRASMGSAFRLPVARRVKLSDAVEAARTRSMPVLATAAGGSVRYSAEDLRRPFLLLVGNEGYGLSSEACASADRIVAIPLSGAVESLNAAVAVAVILFEAARQRG